MPLPEQPAGRPLKVAQFTDNYGPGSNGLMYAVQQLEGNLLDAGHEVGVLAFREFVNAELQHLGERGLTIHDLEDSVGAFNAVLPRVRIIPLEVFDPTRYLL